MSSRLSDQAAQVLATWFGCGLVPKAPGTAGTFGAIPLYLLVRRLGPAGFWLSSAALLGVGLWSAQRTAELRGSHDPQEVVIDEVVGALIALGIAGSLSPAGQIAALALFRVFDITKPGLIDRVQHLKPAGLGIMADDVLAGVAAGSVTRAASLLLRLCRRL